jgi:uncharacterized protein with FMN-binding domain
MKRSILVAAGTAAGVTAVVSYHAAAPSSEATLAASAAPATTTAAATTTPSAAATTTTATTTSTTTTSRSTSSTASATRSAVGEAVGFQYGDLQVKVTERGGRITNVSIVSFQISDPRSESIDEYAVPQLREQVISAQSAHIDGVSGASYTSSAYEQSVQSALDKLA